MNCPVDDTVLQMTERSGIEIDYCPQCRGVWLDRGELDKIIERSESDVPPDDRRYRDRDRRERDDRGYRDDYRGKSTQRGSRKRKNLLGELFDF
ncbi:MAG TPA: zf-TFIIB domain-containing protein [Nitriliruptorales bacterium]|nr:zf-TFIIB domain-containing protein [Nitriliruptorales bacterium]